MGIQLALMVSGYSPADHLVHVSFEVRPPPVHMYSGSIVMQSLLHPSPLVVLLSSHTSEPALNPSPHWITHEVLGASGLLPPVQAVQTLPLQIKPGSIVLQSALQPSPLAVLPSSQTSLPSLSASPHTVTHFVGEDGSLPV